VKQDERVGEKGCSRVEWPRAWAYCLPRTGGFRAGYAGNIGEALSFRPIGACLRASAMTDCFDRVLTYKTQSVRASECCNQSGPASCAVWITKHFILSADRDSMEARLTAMRMIAYS